MTRICGGVLRIATRSDCGVSPVRTCVRMAAVSLPCAASSAAMPLSGCSRLRWMSFDSAFSGETYTTCVASVSSPATACRTSRSMLARNAARVLPEPVGAAISTSRPAAIAGHAAACASVGPSKWLANQRATAG